MVLLTVLLAKGVEACTSVLLLSPGGRRQTRVLSATQSPVWGDDFEVDVDVHGTLLVFELMNGYSKVGQAKLPLDSAQPFGHKPLQVEPAGELMVSWSTSNALRSVGGLGAEKGEVEQPLVQRQHSREAASVRVVGAYDALGIQPVVSEVSALRVRPLDSVLSVGSVSAVSGGAMGSVGGGGGGGGGGDRVGNTKTQLLKQVLEEMRSMQVQMDVLNEQNQRLEVCTVVLLNVYYDDEILYRGRCAAGGLCLLLFSLFNSLEK